MNLLATVTICSRTDLSELETMMKNSESKEMFFIYRKTEGHNLFSFDKKEIPKAAKVLSKWIHEEFASCVVYHMLDKKYDILIEEEKEIIFTKAMLHIAEEGKDLENLIYQKVLVFLNAFDLINLEGFYCFSLKEYKEEIEILLDECLDEYMAEQDYLEYIELLRSFVNIEEPQFGCLTVVAQKDGSYRYYDSKKNDITKICIQKFVSEFPGEYADSDDFLVCILMILLPKQIFLYGIEHIKNKNMIQTLETIFEKRIRTFQKENQFQKPNL